MLSVLAGGDALIDFAKIDEVDALVLASPGNQQFRAGSQSLFDGLLVGHERLDMVGFRED